MTKTRGRHRPRTPQPGRRVRTRSSRCRALAGRAETPLEAVGDDPGRHRTGVRSFDEVYPARPAAYEMGIPGPSLDRELVDPCGTALCGVRWHAGIGRTSFASVLSCPPPLAALPRVEPESTRECSFGAAANPSYQRLGGRHRTVGFQTAAHAGQLELATRGLLEPATRHVGRRHVDLVSFGELGRVPVVDGIRQGNARVPWRRPPITMNVHRSSSRTVRPARPRRIRRAPFGRCRAARRDVLDGGHDRPERTGRLRVSSITKIAAFRPGPGSPRSIPAWPTARSTRCRSASDDRADADRFLELCLELAIDGGHRPKLASEPVQLGGHVCSLRR